MVAVLSRGTFGPPSTTDPHPLIAPLIELQNNVLTYLSQIRIKQSKTTLFVMTHTFRLMSFRRKSNCIDIFVKIQSSLQSEQSNVPEVIKINISEY